MIYREFQVINDISKRKAKELGLSLFKIIETDKENKVVTIETKDNKVIRKIQLDDLINNVAKKQMALSNPSEIANWFDKKETVSIEEVANWYRFYGSGKNAISKILKEYLGDDYGINEFDNFRAKGYDSLIIKNAVVGTETKMTIPMEIVVFDLDAIEIIPNGDYKNVKGLAYHHTNADFCEFSFDHIGEGHGASYGPGIYFSSIPIPMYGRKVTAKLHIKKPFIITNLNDVMQIYHYVNAVLTPKK